MHSITRKCYFINIVKRCQTSLPKYFENCPNFRQIKTFGCCTPSSYVTECKHTIDSAESKRARAEIFCSTVGQKHECRSCLDAREWAAKRSCFCRRVNLSERAIGLLTFKHRSACSASISRRLSGTELRSAARAIVMRSWESTICRGSKRPYLDCPSCQSQNI